MMKRQGGRYMYYLWTKKETSWCDSRGFVQNT
jgi:hypothetical protein